MIANNTVDGAALGISVTNFNEGGRLAVVQGNLIRNLKAKRPAGTDPNDAAGVGIAVEADASVTGNVIENAPTAGINLGWGKYLRDVRWSATWCAAPGYGVTVSVAQGAGTAVIAGNLIAGSTRGAIVGMDFAKAVTGDLAKEPARFAQLADQRQPGALALSRRLRYRFAEKRLAPTQAGIVVASATHLRRDRRARPFRPCTCP